MKTSKVVLAGIIATCGLIVSICAMGSTTDALPETHTQGDVTYVTGGVGLGESDAMRSAAKDYALEIVCLQKATPKDEFLADIKVRIMDSHGKAVLDVITDGPYLLANLPRGGYTVTAELRGTIKHQKVKLDTGKHRKVIFLWDKPPT